MDVDDDARLFCYGIGSRMFADICKYWREELDEHGHGLQVEMLDELVVRLKQMRDETERRLHLKSAAIRGESVEIDGEVSHVSG